MRQTEQLQGLRMLKLRDASSRWEGSELSQLEAVDLLEMSERTNAGKMRTLARFKGIGLEFASVLASEP